MAEQELIFGFKFISRQDDRFTYGTSDTDNITSVFKNSRVSTYDSRLIFNNIKNFTILKRGSSDTIINGSGAIYVPSVNRSDLVIGGGSSTKGYIKDLAGWSPNIYDEANKAYYMLDYVSYVDSAGKETDSKTNAIQAHYKMFIPLYYRADNVDTLVPTIEARNMSTSIGTYSITGIDNRTDSTDSAVIDETYLTPIFSQNMFRFVDGDTVYYSNYSFSQAATCSSYDEIIQWLRSSSIKTSKSNNSITVNVSIPSAYRQIYASESSSDINAKAIPARYKLFLIRNTPGRKSTKQTKDNEKIIIPHSYLINGSRWSHPVPSDRAQYDFTEYFSADAEYDFTYTFDLTNILEQEYFHDTATTKVMTIREYVPVATDDGLKVLDRLLDDIKAEMIRFNIIVCDLRTTNCMVLIESNTPKRVVIFDGYGSPEFIPLPNWCPFLGKRKIKRQWQKLMQRYQLDKENRNSEQ